MNTLLKIVASITGGLAALTTIGWLGLQIPSKLVVPVTENAQTLRGVCIPENLPAPVLRYLHVVLGEHAPRIESAVFWDADGPTLGCGYPCASNSIIVLAMTFAVRCR